MQQRFLLQILLLAQHVSGITMPIIRSSRVLYSVCCVWYFVLWFFSSSWSGVELRVMRPVCRMLSVNPTKKWNCATECTVINFNTFLTKTLIRIHEPYFHLLTLLHLWTFRLYSDLMMVCATETCSPYFNFNLSYTDCPIRAPWTNIYIIYTQIYT